MWPALASIPLGQKTKLEMCADEICKQAKQDTADREAHNPSQWVIIPNFKTMLESMLCHREHLWATSGPKTAK